MADFRAALNKRREDIEDPKLLPPGTYGGIIRGFEMGESKQKKTPFVRFSYTISEMLEGDQDLLAQAGGLQKKDGTARVLDRDDYYLTEGAEARLRNLIDSCIGTEWTNLGEGIEALKGQSVIISLAHRAGETKPDANPSDPVPMYYDITKVVGTFNQ